MTMAAVSMICRRAEVFRGCLLTMDRSFGKVMRSEVWRVDVGRISWPGLRAEKVGRAVEMIGFGETTRRVRIAKRAIAGVELGMLLRMSKDPSSRWRE